MHMYKALGMHTYYLTVVSYLGTSMHYIFMLCIYYIIYEFKAPISTPQ